MTHLVDLNSNYELPKYHQFIVTTPYHILDISGDFLIKENEAKHPNIQLLGLPFYEGCVYVMLTTIEMPKDININARVPNPTMG